MADKLIVPTDNDIDTWIRKSEFQIEVRGAYVIDTDDAEEFVKQVRDRTRAATLREAEGIARKRSYEWLDKIADDLRRAAEEAEKSITGSSPRLP